MLGQILENVGRHARILGEGVDARLVALVEHVLARHFGVFAEHFGGESLIVVDFLQAVVDGLDKAFDDIGVFLGVGAPRHDSLLDEANVHIANLFDADQLAKALLAQHDALRGGNHRAGYGVGAEGSHRFRVAAGLNNDRVANVRSV